MHDVVSFPPPGRCLIAVLLVLASGSACAQDLARLLPDDAGVTLVEVLEHETPSGDRLHALVTGNTRSEAPPAYREFVSVVREGPEGWELLADFAIGNLGFVGDLGFANVDGVGLPEFVRVERSEGSIGGSISASVVELTSGEQFEARWDYPVVGGRPEVVTVTLDENDLPEGMASFGDGILRLLARSDMASDVAHVASPEERAHAHAQASATSRNVHVKADDLCEGYAVNFLAYWPSTSRLAGKCDLEAFAAVIEGFAVRMNDEMLFALGDPRGNVVRGRTMAYEYLEEFGHLERFEERESRLPPWQRGLFEEWVWTDVRVAAEPLLGPEGLLAQFVGDDYAYRWTSDVLRARQICRVADAPDWCTAARGYGFLD